jgi:hypothetical protein
VSRHLPRDRLELHGGAAVLALLRHDVEDGSG